MKQSKQGEFDADHAASLIDATNIFQIVLEKWREFGSRMQTIAFAPNVASAVHMAQFFRDNGERWEAITHLTPKNERRRILDDFRAGKVQGVVNKSVFTEGADFPAAKCLVNLAPTASSLVVAQRLGRVLRLHPSHPEAQVLDFAPTDVRLVLPQDVLAGKEVEEKEATVRAAEAGVEIWAISASKKGVGVIDPSAVQVEILDYMKGSRLPWSYHKGVAVTALKDSESIVIAPPANERIAKLAAIRYSGKWSDALTELELWLKKFRLYRVYKHGVDPLTGKGGKWVTELVGTYDTGREAGRAATSRADVVADQLGHRQAQWRKAPASEPQIGFLRKLGADPNIVADIESDEKRGKGRASRMIDGILRYKNYSQEEERIIRAVYRGGESLEEQAVGWPAVKEKEVEYGV